MSTGGKKIAGSTTIPVKDMALGMLDKILPQCTPEQIAALKAGTPLPTTPKVSCILVFNQPARMRLLQRAVTHFKAQIYSPKELVIVNVSGAPLNLSVPDTVEVAVEPRPNITLGELRNIGISHASGEFIKPCWDDDDYYGPYLLAYQVYHQQKAIPVSEGTRKPDDIAVLLSTQVLANVKNLAAFIYRVPTGIPNTMLVPKDGTIFSHVNQDDDYAYWLANFSNRTVVADNVIFPFNLLNIAVYHGYNVLPVERFMEGHNTPEHHGVWELPAAEAAYLRAVLTCYGKDTTSVKISDMKSMRMF